MAATRASRQVPSGGDVGRSSAAARTTTPWRALSPHAATWPIDRTRPWFSASGRVVRGSAVGVADENGQRWWWVDSASFASSRRLRRSNGIRAAPETFRRALGRSGRLAPIGPAHLSTRSRRGHRPRTRSTPGADLGRWLPNLRAGCPPFAGSGRSSVPSSPRRIPHTSPALPSQRGGSSRAHR